MRQLWSVWPLDSIAVPIVVGAPHVAIPSILVIATQYGSGRVVAFDRHSLDNIGLPLYDNTQFADQMFDWLDSQYRRSVVFTQSHAEWLGDANFDSLKTHLESRGYTVSRLYSAITPAALTGKGVLLIGNAWGPISPSEITAILDFVNQGGGLILCGLGWSWLAYHPGQTMEDYPMVQVSRNFGITWLNGFISDPLHNYEGTPLFYTFYPNVGIQRPADAMAYIDSVTAVHPADLPALLQSDTNVRTNYTNANLILKVAALEAVPSGNAPQDVFAFYRSLLPTYPQYFQKSVTFDPAVQSTMAWLRERMYRTLADALPLTDSLKTVIGSTMGLFGEYQTVWANHSILLLDNTRLDPQQREVVQTMLDNIDSELHNLRAISFTGELGTTSPPVDLGGYGGFVNSFSNTIGTMPGNPFPPDVPPGQDDAFCGALAHEINHIVDAYYVEGSPSLSARKSALIAAAGNDSLNYLRSMFEDGFFQQAPQEFFASIANQWFCDSWKTIQLGLVRFDHGYLHPINQALFYLDVYSLGADSSSIYLGDGNCNVTHDYVQLTRDQNDHIVSVHHMDSTVTFVLDQNGDVIDYSIMHECNTTLRAH